MVPQLKGQPKGSIGIICCEQKERKKELLQVET
jgi:hypothetical protein